MTPVSKERFEVAFYCTQYNPNLSLPFSSNRVYYSKMKEPSVFRNDTYWFFVNVSKGTKIYFTHVFKI